LASTWLHRDDKEFAESAHSARHSAQTSRYGAIMDAVREQWTDERLDDLKGEVATLRAEIRDEFRAVRSEMKDEFRAVRSEIGSLRVEMHAGFDSLHRTMIQFGALLIVALVGLIATQL
jgi:hypothetical protein